LLAPGVCTVTFQVTPSGAVYVFGFIAVDVAQPTSVGESG
jgi:hypothetical protein